MLSRALLHAHSFQFLAGFARVLLPPLQINKQRLLPGELPFTLDYFALDTSQLVINSFGVPAVRVHLPRLSHPAARPKRGDV